MQAIQAFKREDTENGKNSKRFGNQRFSNQKRQRRLQEKSRKAFLKWLEASNKWLSARNKVQYGSESDKNASQRLVQKLEKRVDEAAEAYETARKKAYSEWKLG